ncbi:hypothetical protein B0H16DRAFT_1689026 [Mycena metata]|uniref:F-box domain-containing protein n=1 Tax=Mycena metata TaxID=1033252 RepID=A0AAD7JBJ5_9AGAR|nr:hypothetical protein B0H16DRAFT_1689026 [Mycena metata]
MTGTSSVLQHIPCGYRRLFGQLSRSGIAPLTVKLTLYAHPTSLSSLFDQSERIQGLTVDGAAQYFYEFIGQLRDYNFPILSSLSLDPTYDREGLLAGFSETLPANLLDGRLPNLREVTLKSMGLQWLSLSGLSTLSLTQCGDSSDGIVTPTFDRLLEMLGFCPQLHTLNLDLTIPPPIRDHPYPTIVLPALACLCLRDDVTGCTALLNHLQIPSRASIRIFPFNVNTGMDMKAILVPIRKHVRTPGAQALSLLQMECQARSGDSDGGPGIAFCTMTLFSDTVLHIVETDSPQCTLSLNFHPSTEGALRQIVTKLLHAIPSNLITHLDAHCLIYPREVTWKAIVKLLPALDTVHLRFNDGAVHCVRALTQTETRDPQYQSFPRVRRLYITAYSKIEDNMIANVIDALEEYFSTCNANENPFELLEIDDKRSVLSAPSTQERLDRLFPLMVGRIVCNGRVHDPVRIQQERAAWQAKMKLFRAQHGIDSDSE